MKILLIKPQWFVHGGVYRYLENVRFTPLHLGILAALSEGHDVRAVDGDWEEIPYGERFDLVGITATTFTSERAYAIAQRFEKDGAKTVLGGVHPSLLSQECLRYADSVVIGEAEYVWKDVLRDARMNQLKPVYQSESLTDMNDVPNPRRDLLNESSWFACIQATRGCPNRCKYCYLPMVPWSRFRKRDWSLVIDELSSIRQRLVFFVDDNLFADRNYALSLFERMIPLGKNWSVQMPTGVGRDGEMLDLMQRSGCFNVQVGLQSFNPRSLQWANIKQNRIEEYQMIVENLHKRNILVTAFLIFGFDYDTVDIFDETIDAVKKIGIDEAHYYILTPYPGTALYQELEKEGRLLPDKDRSSFGWSSATFRPKSMTAKELEEGIQYVYERTYPYFKRRLPGALFRHLGLLARNPRLLSILVGGNRRKTDIRRKPRPQVARR